MGTVINQLVNQARQSLCINSFSITLNGVTASNDPASVFCIYKPPYSASSRNARFQVLQHGSVLASQVPRWLCGSKFTWWCQAQMGI